MTEEIYVTDLKEIEGVKVVCEKCKGALTVPIKVAKDMALVIPGKCLYCSTEFGGGRDAIFSFLQTLLKIRNIKDFSFFIESE